MVPFFGFLAGPGGAWGGRNSVFLATRYPLPATRGMDAGPDLFQPGSVPVPVW